MMTMAQFKFVEVDCLHTMSVSSFDTSFTRVLIFHSSPINNRHIGTYSSVPACPRWK